MGRGFEWKDGLFAVVATVLLGGFIVALAVPIPVEAEGRQICAAHMGEIVKGMRLYTEDHDGVPSTRVWWQSDVRPYLAVPSDRLACPEDVFTGRAPTSSYRDMSARSSRVGQMRGLEPSVGGFAVPAFDFERDAVLKCQRHGRDGHRASANFEERHAGEVQSAFWDGHIAFTPPVGCWEMAYIARLPYYRTKPDSLPVCEGVWKKIP